jgi:hypothetical protein
MEFSSDVDTTMQTQANILLQLNAVLLRSYESLLSIFTANIKQKRYLSLK